VVTYLSLVPIIRHFNHVNNFEEEMNDHLEEMIRDISEEHFRRKHVYDSLKFDFEKKLYI